MITIPNQTVTDAELRIQVEQMALRLGLAYASTDDGYLPDEDDPAWPSKSGQAD